MGQENVGSQFQNDNIITIRRVRDTDLEHGEGSHMVLAMEVHKGTGRLEVENVLCMVGVLARGCYRSVKVFCLELGILLD